MKTKTYLPKAEEIKRDWHHIDASGLVLGRLATAVADKLRGKKKRIFISSVDCGDFVVVTNAEKIVLTGKKLDQKMDFRHSGYPGGDTLTSYRKLMETHPERVISLAVEGMLPKNRLSHLQMTRLKVYKGAEHPHAAQFPVAKKEEKTTN